MRDQWLRKALVTRARAIEMGGNETVKQSVMAGMGVSSLSRHTLRLELLHGKMAILPVDGTPVLRSWPHRQSPAACRLPPAAPALRGSNLTEAGAFLADEYGPARPARA